MTIHKASLCEWKPVSRANYKARLLSLAPGEHGKRSHEPAEDRENKYQIPNFTSSHGNFLSVKSPQL